MTGRFLRDRLGEISHDFGSCSHIITSVSIQHSLDDRNWGRVGVGSAPFRGAMNFRLRHVDRERTNPGQGRGSKAGHAAGETRRGWDGFRTRRRRFVA